MGNFVERVGSLSMTMPRINAVLQVHRIKQNAPDAVDDAVCYPYRRAMHALVSDAMAFQPKRCVLTISSASIGGIHHPDCAADD